MTEVQKLLFRLFGNSGYFVEAGAHDGVGDSQTLALERIGWEGLCVEPSSYFDGLLKSPRRCHKSDAVLAGRDGEQVTFREVTGTELSGIVSHFGDHWDRESRPHRDRVMTGTSLTTLLSRYGAPSIIEYLCLDTEGSEHEILSGHDFSKYRFCVIQVEYNGVPSRRESMTRLLVSKGMYLTDDNGTDLIFSEGC